MIQVRDATPADLSAITAIYAEGVLNGTGTFELVAPNEMEMARRMGNIAGLGLPWLVAERDGGVVGYAYSSPFRLRPGYRYTVEDSVYVTPSAKGQGIGRTLLTSLIQRCEPLGLRQMLAVIGDSTNEGSIRLHTACGFQPAGTMPGVGWKFDTWLDVVIMQRQLNAGRDTTPDAPGLSL